MTQDEAASRFLEIANTLPLESYLRHFLSESIDATLHGDNEKGMLDFGIPNIHATAEAITYCSDLLDPFHVYEWNNEINTNVFFLACGATEGLVRKAAQIKTGVTQL